MNWKIRKAKLALIQYLSENELPEEVNRMILKEVYEDMEQKANEAILSEAKLEEEAKTDAESVQPN